jgi:hypothetical protein
MKSNRPRKKTTNAQIKSVPVQQIRWVGGKIIPTISPHSACLPSSHQLSLSTCLRARDLAKRREMLFTEGMSFFLGCARGHLSALDDALKSERAQTKGNNLILPLDSQDGIYQLSVKCILTIPYPRIGPPWKTFGILRKSV